MHSNVGIYSSYLPNIPNEMVNLQRSVFEKFELKIQQDKLPSCDRNPDEEFVDFPYYQHVVDTSDKDYIIFFDIDCIPLTKDFYNIIYNDMVEGKLSGAIGCSNHISPNESYVHACFIGFSMKLYNECGRPYLGRINGVCDVVELFTKVCKKLNKPIKYWEITDEGDKCWPLAVRNMHFGHGTIYENMIYHQYHGRLSEYQKLFMDKCKSVLMD